MLLRLLVLAFVFAAVAGNAELLPFDTRWEYPQYLTFRPGHGQVCAVNPPRFSWPYVPHVIPREGKFPAWDFCLQLSRTGDFADPEIDVENTPYNFHNALPALEPGDWHWRVGYGVDTDDEQWSAVRSFTISPDAVEWDRTIIGRAAQELGAGSHPRLAPAAGWQEWGQELRTDERTSAWLDSVVSGADRATKRAWWTDFPTTDRKGETEYDDQQFAGIAREIALASFAHRLTGDEKYSRAKDLAVALARFPKGGLASPEYHGPPRKWPTQITEYLAVCLDWWHDELTPEERDTILGSIDWRLRATYLEKASWRAGDSISRSGVSAFCQSHPYENFMWSLPAVLLTAGDLPLADELVPLCLHYLTGVTSAHGPDEGWNEGLAYGGWKGQTMLQASAYTALLLPELELGRSPYYGRLGDWYAHLMPLGIQRLAFGDYAANPARQRGVQRNNFRFLTWLTGEPRFRKRWEALAEDVGNGPSSRPWLDLFCVTRFEVPQEDVQEPTRALFPEAGWVMVSTESPSDAEGFGDAVGMIFKCRPRGGYSHSYRSENDFVWHAYGQTLSAGGGGTPYPDPHSRHSMSHNVLLINGRGQEWNARNPASPFCGRLLAYTEGDNYIHWVGDATHAYQSIPELLRWHRHVVFVDGKWFAVFDDLAMRPEADPVRFSWLFHIAPDVPLSIDLDRGLFSYKMGDVNARVAFAGDPSALALTDLPGRDGYQNPITQEDVYQKTAEALRSKGRELSDEQLMAHNVWVTNAERAREWTFLAALTAWRENDEAPKITFDGERSVKVDWADGTSQSVAFAPGTPADITVDLDAVRAHALATDAAVLPPGGLVEDVEVGGDAYRIEWLAAETFDGWLSRWAIEGNSEVRVRDGKFWVRDILPDKANLGTFWFRPELPENVIVRFRAKAVPPAEENAANLNLLLHARELDGSAIRYGRNGQYNLYHEIPNYIVTLVGGFREPGWSRARRDPGFNLLHEADVRSEVGQEYEIVVTCQGGRLRYYLDGAKLHDVEDPEPLPAGKFAIRTWNTDGWWDDVEVGRIVRDGG